jgi:hypothetical protein
MQVKETRVARGRVSFYHESECVSHHESGRVSFYHESGRISHSLYKEMSVRMVRPHLYPPYKVCSQLGQNSGGARSHPILTLFLSFLSHFGLAPL